MYFCCKVTLSLLVSQYTRIIIYTVGCLFYWKFLYTNIYTFKRVPEQSVFYNCLYTYIYRLVLRREWSFIESVEHRTVLSQHWSPFNIMYGYLYASTYIDWYIRTYFIVCTIIYGCPLLFSIYMGRRYMVLCRGFLQLSVYHHREPNKLTAKCMYI